MNQLIFNSMKRIYTFIFVTMAMLMLSVNSAWAQYVKLTAEDGSVSWIEIEGNINGTNIVIYKADNESAIDQNTKGSIDLNEVWSRSGGRGTHYQVTSIGTYAFGGCNGLTSVTIPSNVKNIWDYAFGGCSGLTSITIPSSMTGWIGGSVFSGCSGLTSIVVESGNSVYDSRENCNAIIETASNTLIVGCKNSKIPSSVTSIGEEAFLDCSGLKSIEIPSSVTSIGNWAFVGCSDLNSVVIHSGVTNIGCEAFKDCSGLTSVVIPSSVTSIAGNVFVGCSDLTSIVVESGNSVFDSRNNCNAIIETASNTLIAGCKNTKIPSNVTDIGGRAFYGCSGLTSIEIPSSVTGIGNKAFYGCTGLISVTSYITNVFYTGDSADGDTFFGCENATLYVPRGLASIYRSKADWDCFNNIVESIALAMSCNNKGKVMVNGGVQFTNDMGEVSVYDGTDNTFVFTPEENCQLEQVLIDGLDVTLSVKNNQLTTKVHEGSKMIVTFSKSSGDMNGDGKVNISDVVALVNLILGQ